MVSIALRSYINDIGDMIDHQQIAESIAHCRHILETYPKHVDTYRLLGKAYLEEKRYGDASDILQRVLSSVPEDFIAHVGMSIIREDEGNLDAAIYHMERAFETQPSNHAIQDELRRLHANRDGIEPPRIRLTRGALARMYAHGHLFDQAIAELLAAISEDSQRFDLQTLLAEMYYQTGKKVDAAETCTKILEKLPYCLQANQLLTMILEANNRADDAQRYRQRWEALDPYAAFTDQDNSNPDIVPDSKAEVERLEWEPESYLDGGDGQPAWASSLGVTVGQEEETDEAVPAWLTSETASDEEESFDFEREEDDFFDSGKASDAQLFEEDEAEPAAEDWLRDTDEQDDLGLFAGESFDSEPAAGDDDDFDLFASLQKPTSGLDPTASDTIADDNADDDDWMAEFAIPDSSDTPSDKDETLDMKGDWLASLETTGDEDPAPVSDAEPEEKPDWLTSFDTEEDEEASALAEGGPDDVPDWLASFDTAEDGEAATLAEGEPEEDEDDWLASLGAADEEETEAPEDDWMAAVDAEEEDTPAFAEDEPEEEEDDWLASLGAADEEETEAPEDDWQAAVDAEEEDTPAFAEDEPEEEEVELPDFLKEAGWEKAPSDADDTADIDYETEEDLPEELEEVEIPDWIQELAPTEDRESSPLPSEVIAEADPEWLDEMEQQPTSPTPDWLSELDETAPEMPTEESPKEEEPVLGQQIEADDLDMAWLESLAAKQGIPDEELVTSPEQRADASERQLFEETPEEEVGEIESEADWLSELDTQPEAPAEETPSVLEDEDDFDMDWLDEIGQQAAEEAAATSLETPPAAAADDEIDLDDWLTGLETQPEAPAPPEAEVPVEAALPPEEEPETSWLDEIDMQADETEAEDQQSEDDWLADLGEGDDETDSDADWLSELDAQPETSSQETPPVLEDEDDFDMDWLDEIGQQAAEEAAETPLEPAAIVEDGDQTEDDWLTDMDEREGEAETDADWRSKLDTQPESPAQETSPILEDEDDFDKDWLDEVGQQAAEEAEEVPTEDEKSEEAWLAELADQEQETASDWGLEEATQPETPAPPEDEGVDQDAPLVQEDKDDFDTDWLKSIGEEAAAEAAATSIEASTEEDVEEIPDWLSDVESEFDTEEPIGDDTMGRFLSGLQETEEEDEPGVKEFLSGLDQDETAPGDQTQGEDLISTPEEDLEAFSLEDLVEPDLETDEEIHLAQGDLDEFSAEFEPATIEAEPEDTPPLEETPEQVTDLTEDWQPESQMEEPPGPEVADIPQAIDPGSPQGILEAASKAADKGELDQALKGFSTLIKKGKLVEDVIRELTEALRRHPVDVQLWQALGDAYMRIDDMQEALDAYTKAEELLR